VAALQRAVKCKYRVFQRRCGIATAHKESGQANKYTYARLISKVKLFGSAL